MYGYGYQRKLVLVLSNVRLSALRGLRSLSRHRLGPDPTETCEPQAGIWHVGETAKRMHRTGTAHIRLVGKDLNACGIL